MSKPELPDAVPFAIRTYSKAELAMLYSPDQCINVALKTLSRWMRNNPLLMDDLYAVGYNKYRKTLTPREVERIVNYLGVP